MLCRPNQCDCVRTGFTLVELIVGLAILAMVAAAVTGIILTSAEGWKATDTAQISGARSSQGAASLYRTLAGIRYAGLATTDVSAPTTVGAALMFWKTDPNDDGQIQGAEVALIEHDIANQQLVLYELPTGAAGATIRYLSTDIADSADAAAFKTLPGITQRPIAGNVTQASFRTYFATSASQRQIVEFVLTFNQNRTEYGTVGLRCARVPDDK